MKISVVVPVFNSAQILNELIKKIKITLSEFKFEVILLMILVQTAVGSN